MSKKKLTKEQQEIMEKTGYKGQGLLGLFFILAALIIIGTNFFFRYKDSHKYDSYKCTEGTVIESIVSKIPRPGTRGNKYDTDYSIRVEYYMEGSDKPEYFSNSDDDYVFLRRGKVVKVYYDEDDCFIAKKDALTGLYVPAEKKYDQLLIIAIFPVIIGLYLIIDYRRAKKRALNGQLKIRERVYSRNDPDIERQQRQEKNMQIAQSKIRIGDTVTITVDHPLGSRDKKLYYPVNYGYIKGFAGGIKAYILGIEDPVKEFTGEVVGIVRREDDTKRTLVVSHKDSLYTAEQVMHRIKFNEKDHKSRVIVKLKDIGLDPETIENLGFEIKEGHVRYFFYMDNTPTKEQIQGLLNLLSEKEELFFWNFYHWSGSDPGAYISAYVANGKAIVRESNHGWSSGYKSIKMEDLIELIIRNWDKDWDLNKDYVNAVAIMKTFYPDDILAWIEKPTGNFTPDYSITAW
ncbi:MAG: DUF3592 domain-containing protein [Clostridia bacterium]|nr:DUF3592 domain-containing protein [Clostridia bacterium]